MLSIKHQFLFIHLPKTAGNSIQNVLCEYSEDNKVCLNAIQDGVERFEIRSNDPSLHKHSSLQQYRDALAPNLFDKLFVFTTVRNPWERMISFYFSPHRQMTEWNKDSFIQLVNSVATLPELLSLKESRVWSENVNKVMRFEHLQHDFDSVCHDIGIPCAPLYVRNKSTRADYITYYDAELISLVREKFSEEIAFGDYHFSQNIC
ncbi:sulfotransferase family 2 domain-containing protein [Shewanella goraebulensis]|uniref:sulfotransferase family 2 domain-containing protein n=1 Tax=Shewanella goraebulensis TaxID=3050637 RepID=UPI00254E86EE|nr:sulfotransferase family 2 domain-containing protein [Shewanella goraebulensis]